MVRQSPNSWLVCPKPIPTARLRLFCLPYAGGGTVAFRTWPASLPPDVELWAIQLPGRERRIRDTPFSQLAALLDALRPALVPFLDRPFAFFGHSMGALVSFELTRTLRDAGQPLPIHLFVSGCRAPQRQQRDKQLHQLPDRLFISELRKLGGTPEAVLREEELMALLLPAIRADFALVENYRFTAAAPLPVGLSAYGGTEDSLVTEDALAAWREHVTGSFSLRLFPGDHFFLHSQGRALLEAVSRALTGLAVNSGGLSAAGDS